jgi:hypothetical protein
MFIQSFTKSRSNAKFGNYLQNKKCVFSHVYGSYYSQSICFERLGNMVFGNLVLIRPDIGEIIFY